MSYARLKILTVFIPPFIIGGFEYIRHHPMLHRLSMDTGNILITLISLLLSYLFATWMFRKISVMNQILTEERSRRAVYEERERMARELHDNIAQSIFFLNVKLRQGKTQEALEAVSEIDHHVRQAIFNLKNPPEGEPLLATLQKWLHEWSIVTGIEVESQIETREEVWSASEKMQLLAIIQEAFTNIRKHSHTEKAHLCLKSDGFRWELTIHDEGIGLSEQAERQSTYGLSIVRKRAYELGASLDILSSAGEGTTIRIKSEGRNRI